MHLEIKNEKSTLMLIDDDKQNYKAQALSALIRQAMYIVWSLHISDNKTLIVFLCFSKLVSE